MTNIKREVLVIAGAALVAVVGFAAYAAASGEDEPPRPDFVTEDNSVPGLAKPPPAPPAGHSYGDGVGEHTHPGDEYGDEDLQEPVEP